MKCISLYTSFDCTFYVKRDNLTFLNIFVLMRKWQINKYYSDKTMYSRKSIYSPHIYIGQTSSTWLNVQCTCTFYDYLGKTGQTGLELEFGLS